jgi:hypothetical protein
MIRRTLVSLSALMLATGVANAAPVNVGGSYTLTPTGTNGVVTVFDDLTDPFSIPLTVGTPDTLDFITLTPDPGNGTKTYNFTIDASFNITQPGTASDADLGTGTFHVRGNSIDSGSLTWADGSSGDNITLSDGAVLNLNLSDVSFGGSAGSGTPETVTATFTLVSGPLPAVPEPATLAILGSALLGLGAMRGRLPFGRAAGKRWIKRGS